MFIIRESNIHGKGAFALKDFLKEQVLECDVLEITKSTIVEDYIFPFIGSRVCIHVGWASFLNSSDTPNLRHLKIDTNKKISYFLVLENISIGEELTMKYL
jgi:hypothetical protein